MPPKPRVFHDPPPPGAPRKRTPFGVQFLLFAVAVIAAVAVGPVITAFLVPPAGDGGITVEYADGILSVRYAPATPANLTVVRVLAPSDQWGQPGHPLIEREYGARAFNDTIDLRAHAVPLYDVVIEEEDGSERRYHYWSFRASGLGWILGAR